MSELTTVLLHGAGTGAWIWEAVINAMRSPTVALDVPGRQVGVTPDSCAAALVAELDGRQLDTVVCVVHSLAGVLVPGLAARLGYRLKHAVYLAAVVPPTGGSFVDALGFPQRILLRLLFKFNPKGLKPGPAMIKKELCNDLDPTLTSQVISQYTPEFPGLYLAPAAVGAIPRQMTYIKLLQDQSVLPAQQDAMIARLGNPSVKTLDTGHLAMLAAPIELAALLDQIAAAS